MTEEHKRKIGEANRIALRKFYDANPNYKNNGMFKKGHERIWTEEEKMKVSRENSYLWKGGVSRLTAKKVCIEAGKDLTTCQICKEKVRTLIHHVNGDDKDNRIQNLGVVCFFCHNAIHDNPNRRATRFQVGHEVSQEIRNKISIANMGKTAWNKGINTNPQLIEVMN